MTSVVIAEPAYLVREGFKTIIEKSEKVSLIGEITKKEEFHIKVESLKPDILVIDANTVNFVEVEELSKVGNLSPSTKVLVISDHYKKENILKIINNGALGYLTKGCCKDEILNALESVSRGEKFFCSKILDIILEEKHDVPKNFSELTDREIEIIRLITEKYSNQDIAEKLFISIHTVYTHRKNIMKKLKLKSPVELILYAIDSGIIPS